MTKPTKTLRDSRKNTQAHERAEPSSLAQLVATHDDPAVLIDEHYTILATNTAYARAYGSDGDNLAGQKCHRVSHHSDVPCHQRGEDCPVKRVMREGRPVETLHIHFHEDATPERVQVRGYPIDLGGRRLLLERIHRLEPDEPSVQPDTEEIVGDSPAILSCLQRLLQAGQSSGSVLVQGESGVGKELAAQFVHRHSAVASGPFVTADCAAMSESLIESELFGHERGAFTSAVQRRAGLFESAHNGTLFLDEIGELPMTLQAKLLRAIETGEIRRLGATKTIQTRVRIIAASNRDLRTMVDAGRFRLDLYFRLATHEVLLPPLRERLADLPMIARHLVSRLSPKKGAAISDKALARLQEHHWPGNIRELRNVIERALASGNVIELATIEQILEPRQVHDVRPDSAPRRDGAADTTPYTTPPHNASAVGWHPPARDNKPGTKPLERARIELLHDMLERHKGNRAKVGQALGVSERTVYRWIRRYQIHVRASP